MIRQDEALSLCLPKLYAHRLLDTFRDNCAKNHRLRLCLGVGD
jgi:hypothetical protein